jgi:ubiquinone/menaquinone biosynthesis C-methylase UbiE
MTKLNIGAGPHELDGFVNLDQSSAWQLEDGLHDFADSSVEAITVSHVLMYVPLSEWPPMFAEFARVLEPGGILRVTEDSTADPESQRYGGWHDAATLTSPDLVREQMKQAGLKPRKQKADTSGFKDRSLLQAWHGDEPKVFFVEGRKP